MDADSLTPALHRRLLVPVSHPDPSAEFRLHMTIAKYHSKKPGDRSEQHSKEDQRWMRQHRLLEWTELPEWQKEDNSYVETGYRPPTPSVLQCIWSWRYLHNETVNILSHLIGAVLFFALPFVLYHELSGRYATSTVGDQAVFGVYLFGVATCFTLSVGFHTLTSHSQWGFNFGIQLDFQGIILLMWSATAPMVYYTFIDDKTLRIVYWCLSSFFAVLASIMTFTPAFHKPATKPLRAGTFGSLALSTLVGVIHGLTIHGWNEQSWRFPMWGIGLTLLFNTIGATVYVFRFPERYWRRTFDILGASHQLMHISIIIAGLCWLAGMISAFDHAHIA